MTDSPIPSIPTPPMASVWRDRVYAFWAWGSVLILTVIAGWSVIGHMPVWMFAIATGMQAFGTYAGFMAKNHVR